MQKILRKKFPLFLTFGLFSSCFTLFPSFHLFAEKKPLSITVKKNIERYKTLFFKASMSPEEILNFARFLEERGEYFRAISEYDRYHYFFAHSKDKSKIARSILRCHYMGGDYAQGIARLQFFQSAKEIEPISSAYYYHFFMKQNPEWLQLVQKELKNSQTQSEGLYKMTDNVILLNPKYFLLGNNYELNHNQFFFNWLHYQNFWLAMEQHDLAFAQEQLKKITSKGPVTGFQKNYRVYNWNELKRDFLSEMKEWNPPHATDPWLAAMSSAIVPGTGQILNGRYSDGIISFLTIALTGSLSYLAYHYNEKNLAILMGSVTILFYSGNIYGAYQSSARNRKVFWQEKINAMQQRFPYHPDFSYP